MGLDFLKISTRPMKKGGIEVYPKFLIRKVSDLMIRGGDFYAIWIEEKNIWSSDEHDAIALIDRELRLVAEECQKKVGCDVSVQYLWDATSGQIDAWHKYCQKQMRDSYHSLDERLIFANMETIKTDYVTRKLPYSLEAGDISSYDSLVSVLYSKEERRKLEWVIGSIVSGDSVSIQKFMVLYGAAGTGKSTVINIIQKLFEGYYAVFDAKALGSTNNSFALEAFKTNPLIAIQHDGDLSKIGDNTRLNSLVSHELMTVNEKFKSTYSNQFKAFLIMGTNKPVKITDAKSGLIRRLIDVSPTGKKLPGAEYRRLYSQIDFELGAIAQHCLDVYLDNLHAYDSYIPTAMLGASNDFYNFMEDRYFDYKKMEGITMKAAWNEYLEYCSSANVPYPFAMRTFKEEIKNYFNEYKDRYTLSDGTRVRSYLIGFRTDKFEAQPEEESDPPESWIVFDGVTSIFDKACADCLAQYANDDGSPINKWAKVKTKLTQIKTDKLHYVMVQGNHIVVDFDLKDSDGNKSLELNLKEASKWPETYVELSKSGGGLHLHYIYTGDVSKLSRVYDDHIEVKVFTGNSSLRRKLTKFNSKPINKINSGLPLKGDDKMINFDAIKSEKGLRTLILRNLNKEIHPGTKPSIDFIKKILDDAYESDLSYDVSELYNAVFAFAASSSNHAEYCIDLVGEMYFKSEEPSVDIPSDKGSLIFYDVEVFPNLFVVVWKKQGPGCTYVKMINPSPDDIRELLQFKLVGFNCRRYDNHILYARALGFSLEKLYEVSQSIINNKPNAFFREAYNVSYTDIYDFASAGNKMSLKKAEIVMGIHHQELGLPWDEPVPESKWEKVADYCVNDVMATEAWFDYLKGDWTARQILADLTGMSVNTPTNTLSTKFIFGNNRKPQGEFQYRDMSKPVDVEEIPEDVHNFLTKNFSTMMETDHNGSALPYFEGYEYKFGKSTYRGEEVGEGGYVYAEPGMHTDVALLDVASMHPTSASTECLFGATYTRIFKDIVDGRLAIKHQDWDLLALMFDGKLIPYIDRIKAGDISGKDLSNALKTVINSVYGLTSASFENAFNDPRNIDNIVAKRGALFMIDLKYEVQKRGFTVAHIKTDSIKIPNATPEIIQFVMDFGQKYGYTFEHEATYEKMCLVNDAVYIAKHDGHWTATGKQFAVPYVFKTLFSKEDIEFKDMCETFSVQTALYLDMNENLENVEKLEKEHDKICKRLVSDEPIPNNEIKALELRLKELDPMIESGHRYDFVGRVGLFSPIKPGCGGGILLREGTRNGNKVYTSANGAKGYRWLESEMVEALKREDEIDRSYYDKLVDKALDTIGVFGDVEWFLAD